jgi:hypothetical protein
LLELQNNLSPRWAAADVPLVVVSLYDPAAPDEVDDDNDDNDADADDRDAMVSSSELEVPITPMPTTDDNDDDLNDENDDNNGKSTVSPDAVPAPAIESARSRNSIAA